MKCFILGGNGFIRSHLVDRLLAEGHQVRVFDVPAILPDISRAKEELGWPPTTTLEIGINKRRSFISQLFRKMDIYHD